jgi:acyl-CoA thioester hydrolase
MMPVYENKSRFIAPTLYDELLTIKTMIRLIPSARVVFYYEILNSTEKVVHLGETTLVFVKMENNRLTTAPKDLLAKLYPYFEK